MTHARPLLAALWALAACGEPASTVADASVSAHDAARPDGATGGDPVGTWALRRVIATNSQAPVVGATTTTTVTLSRLDVSRDGVGGALLATDDVCGISLESSNSLAVPSLVPAYAASLATSTYPAAVVGGALVLSPPVDLRGCALTDPASEPLPTLADDARVTDDDDDGHPGLTVRLQITGLGAQAVYVVQRLAFAMRSDSLGTDRISGPIEVTTFEQNVIGASTSLLAGNPAVAVARASTAFTMVRVAAGTSCAQVLAAGEPALFGPR